MYPFVAATLPEIYARESSLIGGARLLDKLLHPGL
jgi:hypothetical protein